MVVFVWAAAGCAHDAVVVDPAADAPIANGGETPTPPLPVASATFPAPRAQLVPQEIESPRAITLRVLDDGRLLVADARGLHVAIAGVGIVRRIELPYEARRRLLGVDAAGRWAATSHAFVDLVTGEVRRIEGAGRIAGCTRDASRCVVVSHDRPESFAVRVVAPDSPEPLDTFELPVPPGSGSEIAYDLARIDATIDGDRLALQLRFAPPDTIVSLAVVYAIASRTFVGRASPHGVDAIGYEFTGPHLLMIRSDGWALLDPATPDLHEVARLRSDLVHDVPFGARATARTAEGWVIVDRRTLATTPVSPPEDAVAYAGAEQVAYLATTSLTWADASGQTLRSVPVEAVHEHAQLRLDARGVFLVDRAASGRLVHLGPDDSATTSVPIGVFEPDYERVEVVVRERGMTLAHGDLLLSVGDASSAVRADHAPASRPDRYERRQERFEELAPGHRAVSADHVALPLPGSPYGLAFVDGDHVQLLAPDGAAVGTPRSIPARVRRSGCAFLDFISDVEVALHGRAPCIPTRLRLDRDAARPLGAAYVAIDATPDGSRVAVMADRRVFVLDGRTGATLVDVDPQVTRPRNLEIADDGSQVVLIGNDLAIIDLAPLPTPDATRRVVHVPNTGWRYASDRARLVACIDGQLALVAPFAPETSVRYACAACEGDSARFAPDPSDDVLESTSGEARIRWLGRGFAVVSSAFSRVSIVRLRDGDELRLDVLRAPDRLEALVTHGDEAWATIPADATRLLSIGPDGQRSVMPTATAASEAAIRAFFAD